ncbi:hypothetical protein P3W24_06725 [Luteibacter sp. PPL201]|uniref:Uncharacterized protein n=1 Tax=Luteibacter sahnii TaxID=3021977 RepID=A0ABT6B958_9GAMM
MLENNTNLSCQTGSSGDGRAPTKRKKQKSRRPSWREVPVGDLSSLRHVVDNMPMVMRTVFELAELDPSLFRPDERLRLRLLVDRVIGSTPTDAVGQAIRDIYTLRRRGFPVSAISDAPPPRKGREEARHVIQMLRAAWNRVGPDAVSESLWVEKTLDFLEQRSRN